MFRLSLLPIALGLILSLEAVAGSLPEPRKLAGHSYAWIGPYGPPTAQNGGFRMNLGFVVGNEAVAVIDSGYGDAMAREMLEQIARLTDRPVRYVINTNSQPHRILGNAVFRERGARIVAAAGAVSRMTGEGAAMASVAANTLQVSPEGINVPGNPNVVVTQANELDLGGISLRVIPVGTAHTAGSVVVEVEDDNVVFAGDVLYGGRLLAVLPVSRVDHWIAAYDQLAAFGDALFVPGHGEPGPLSDFRDSTRRYLATLLEHMDNAVESGATLDEAVDALDQGDWADLADFESLARRNAYQAFIEREVAAFE